MASGFKKANLLAARRSRGAPPTARALGLVARVSLDDCYRMAAVLAQYHCDTRQAGQLYAAWRDGSAVIRQRMLQNPSCFSKRSGSGRCGSTPWACMRRPMK